MSDTPAWFEDEFDTDRRPRRRLLLLLAAGATVWLVITLVLVRGSGPATVHAGGDPGEVEDPSGPEDPAGIEEVPHPGRDEEHAGTGHPAPEGEAALDAQPAPAPDDEAGPVPASRDEAEALALTVVRGWLSDAGPDLHVPGIEVDRRAYLEHAAVEGFDLPSADLAVARILLVLLVRDGDHYTEAVVRRAAVPLTIAAADVHPAGPPWWLPDAPDLTPVPPATHPLTEAEDEAAALEALSTAGYGDPEIVSLAVTDGGTVVAHVTATTPAGDALDGPLWLHPTAAGLVVLGGGRGAGAGTAPPPDAPDG